MRCSGAGANASVMAFAEHLGNGSFATVDEHSIVFGPHDATDNFGTEDPRVAYDERSGTYFMFYTCYNDGHAAPSPRVTLCLATSADPTSSARWVRHGPVGFGENSKSGALLLRRSGPHFLLWGAGTIRITRSDDPTRWADRGTVLLEKAFGNPHVEAGPPPLLLSNGDYVFFFNSWTAVTGGAAGYQPGWVVLNGSDPTQIVARAAAPMLSPVAQPWLLGEKPWTCNVPKVAFVEAAHPVAGAADSFRLYLGGADAVVGSAVVTLRRSW